MILLGAVAAESLGGVGGADVAELSGDCLGVRGPAVAGVLGPPAGSPAQGLPVQGEDEPGLETRPEHPDRTDQRVGVAVCGVAPVADVVPADLLGMAAGEQPALGRGLAQELPVHDQAGLAQDPLCLAAPDIAVLETFPHAAGHIPPPPRGYRVADGEVAEPAEHLGVDRGDFGLAARRAEQRLERPGHAALAEGPEPGLFLLPSRPPCRPGSTGPRGAGWPGAASRGRS